ncbi:MAG: hypothetical protein PVG39_00395 [Desulfobacteraceae bacterium]|jgi:hypothetical protein
MDIYKQAEKRKNHILELQRTINWMCNKIDEAMRKLPEEPEYAKLLLDEILTDERYHKK